MQDLVLLEALIVNSCASDKHSKSDHYIAD